MTDKQIDQLVYELYGLTEQEIEIIEERCEIPSVLKIADGRARRATRKATATIEGGEM